MPGDGLAAGQSPRERRQRKLVAGPRPRRDCSREPAVAVSSKASPRPTRSATSTGEAKVIQAALLRLKGEPWPFVGRHEKAKTKGRGQMPGFCSAQSFQCYGRGGKGLAPSGLFHAFVPLACRAKENERGVKK